MVLVLLKKKWKKDIKHKIYHFGGVEIEDNVEIGANTTIDKAVLEKQL